MPTAEILSQGDEVITGQTVDTNAAWLAEQLTELGFTVLRHTVVGDRVDDIRDLVAASAKRADLCVCTGGLGPTDDDLTAQAVAEALDRPLELDRDALTHIEGLYARLGWAMSAPNIKQAFLPRGCRRMDNHWGTAPGFLVEAHDALLSFFPGVPRELRAMFTHVLRPLLLDRFAIEPARLITLRTTGIGESKIQERIGTFDHPGIVLGYRTILPENHVKLRVSPATDDAEVRKVVDELRQRIGQAVFAVDGLGEPGGSLAEVVGRGLIEAGETLATAESCTGGQVGALCTAVPGASAWFLEGLITYSNQSKVRLLGVDPQAIESHGAVSELVARQMARGARERAGSTYGIGITGIAGPGGGTDDKPVGTVHVALASPEAVHHRALLLPGDRGRVQSLAVARALDLLRRHLQGTLKTHS